MIEQLSMHTRLTFMSHPVRTRWYQGLQPRPLFNQKLSLQSHGDFVGWIMLTPLFS